MTTTGTKTGNGASNGEKAFEHDEPRARPAGTETGDRWRFVRALPRAAQVAMKSHPVAVMAGVGATTFVLGALCGSRVGRLIMTSLAQYGLRRLIEGPLVGEVARRVNGAVQQAGARG
jgi:hypothetical protein